MKRSLNVAAAASAVLFLLLVGTWMFCPLNFSFNIGPNWLISPGGGDVWISHNATFGEIDRIYWDRFGFTYWYDPVLGPDRWELTIALITPIMLTLICPMIWLGNYHKHVRVQQRIANRQCPNCGYDVRASKHECPECGGPIARRS